MKFTDNRKYKNARIWKEKSNSRDKRENMLHVPTGFLDMRGEPILSGSVVLIYPTTNITSQDIRIGVVLWDNFSSHYCAMSGCWYLDRNYSNPRCYGKVEREFDNKAGTTYSSVLVVDELSGKWREDDDLIYDLIRKFSSKQYVQTF